MNEGERRRASELRSGLVGYESRAIQLYATDAEFRWGINLLTRVLPTFVDTMVAAAEKRSEALRVDFERIERRGIGHE